MIYIMVVVDCYISISSPKRGVGCRAESRPVNDNFDHYGVSFAMPQAEQCLYMYWMRSCQLS